MRLFLGFPVPDALSLELMGVRDQAIQRMAAIRPLPVVAGNFHMTLIFLGEVTAAKMEQIAAVTEQFCAVQSALRLQLQRGHCFPDSAGRVFAAEAQLTSGLSRFHRLLQEALGEPAGRPLRPHITLARLPRAFVPAPDMPLDLSYEITELCLYESEQSQWGVRYRVRRRWPLTGSDV
jgi:2'-5' RNA ligase